MKVVASNDGVLVNSQSNEISLCSNMDKSQTIVKLKHFQDITDLYKNCKTHTHKITSFILFMFVFMCVCVFNLCVFLFKELEGDTLNS